MIVIDADKKELIIRENTVAATKAGTGIKIVGLGAAGWRLDIRDNVILPGGK